VVWLVALESATQLVTSVWGSEHHELKEPAGDYASHSLDHGVAVVEVEEEAGMPEKV
jgi:hypothetical protein